MKSSILTRLFLTGAALLLVVANADARPVYGVAGRRGAVAFGPNRAVAVGRRGAVVAGPNGVAAVRHPYHPYVRPVVPVPVPIVRPVVPVIAPLPYGYIRVVPAGYRTVVYGGYSCFYVGGIYYRPVIYGGDTVYVVVD